MEQLEKLGISLNHDISECWHPHYHDSFNQKASEILQMYLSKNNRCVHVVPLCMFGGRQMSHYLDGVSANTTYAVCSSCKNVMMCGYSDTEKLGPKSCRNCKTKLNNNDYFQSITLGKVDLKINPNTDPIITIAEVCAYVPKGILLDKLFPLILICSAEQLLQTNFISRFTVEHQRWRNADDLYMQLDANEPDLKNLLLYGHNWVNFNHSNNHIELTSLGRIMLSAKHIKKRSKTKERIKTLLNIKTKKLHALAIKFLAEKILTQESED